MSRGSSYVAKERASYRSDGGTVRWHEEKATRAAGRQDPRLHQQMWMHRTDDTARDAIAHGTTAPVLSILVGHHHPSALTDGLEVGDIAVPGNLVARVHDHHGLARRRATRKSISGPHQGFQEAKEMSNVPGTTPSLRHLTNERRRVSRRTNQVGFTPFEAPPVGIKV